jgi:hypothetical protein
MPELVNRDGLSAQDRAKLLQRYGFLEFASPGPSDGSGAARRRPRRSTLRRRRLTRPPDLPPRSATARYDLAVSEQVTAPPAICLNMIVRNEAHIVQELLDSVAPYVSSWVVVDTASDDGTQDVIRKYLTPARHPRRAPRTVWRN